MLKLILILCGVYISFCYATPSCHELQQSQLASLNERMTQMINSLYTSPIAAKANLPPPLSNSNATPSDCPYDASYYQYPFTPPQVIYVSPPVSYPPNIPPPKPAYYPYTPEYPEIGMKPTWSSYYDQPYPAPVFPPMAYPSPQPPLNYPTPSPYPPVPYSPTYPQSYPSTPYPPSPTPYTPSPTPYPPSGTPYPPSPTPYPPVPAYPYNWDSYPEYSKPGMPAPQGYQPVAPPYPYPRPEVPPMPYYA